MKPAPPVTTIRMVRSGSTQFWPDDRLIIYEILASEVFGRLGEPRMPPIAVGQHGLAFSGRPGDGEGGIVPGDAALALGPIGRGHLVENLGVRLERAEAVSEALRNPDLVPAGRGQL